MAGIYDGEPVVSKQDVLSEETYIKGVLSCQGQVSPFSRRGVRIAACFTGIAFLLSLLPMYNRFYSTSYAIFCGIVVLLVLALRFFLLGPQNQRIRAQRFYQSNRLLQLPFVFKLQRDSMEAESERQNLHFYWTDFYACYETQEAFLLPGAPGQSLIILQKEAFEREQVALLSEFFEQTFGIRYRKLAH